MAAINFPASPSNGDTHQGFVYNSTLGVWNNQGTTVIPSSATAPASPRVGDLWFDNSSGTLYFYYNDGSSSQWVGVTGAPGPTGPTGPTGPAGASGLIQTVFTEKTDTFTGTSNGTPLLVTGMSASITPSSSSNKIYLSAQISYSQLSTTYKAWFKRTIGSGTATDVHVGDAAGSRQRTSIPLALVTDTNQANSFILQFVDEPATTDQITYQLYVINDNSIAFNLNRSNADADSSTGGRYISTIILQELGA